MLVMPAPSSIYVPRASLGHRGLLSSKRQWASMMLVQRGSRLHCTVTCAECSAWNKSVCKTVCDAFWRWPVAVRRQRLLPLLAGKAVGWRWDGGSSVVSCSQTPPLQPRRPLTTSRTAQASEDVQPANRQARTPTISSAHAAHWAGGGGKNSIYAPMAIRPSHSSILLAWTAPETSVDLPAQPRVGLRSISPPSPTTASVRRLAQTLRDLSNPHGEANGVDE
jgi:hypothetical protein